MATATTPRKQNDAEYKERWNESREPPIFRRSITADELKAFKIALARSYKLKPGEESLIRHEFQNIKIVDDSDLNDTYKFTDRSAKDQDGECERRKFGTTDIDFMWLVFKMFVERAHADNEPARQEWREIYKIKIMMPEGAREKALALRQQRMNMSSYMGTMSLNPADAFSGFQGSNQSGFQGSNQCAGRDYSGQYSARSDAPVVEEIHDRKLLALPPAGDNSMNTPNAPNAPNAPNVPNTSNAMNVPTNTTGTNTCIPELPKPVMRTGVKRPKGRITVN